MSSLWFSEYGYEMSSSHESSPGHSHSHAHSHEKAHAHTEARHHESTCCEAADALLPSRPDTLKVGPGQVLSRLRIHQMDCPTEETLIRKKLQGMPDIHALQFNLMQRVLTVVHTQGALDKTIEAIAPLDMSAEPLSDMSDTPPVISSPPINAWAIAAAGVLAALSEVAHFAAWPDWLSAGLALAAILACGLTTYRKGWIAIRHGNLNINALMSLAVTGAMLIGQWPEAAMVMFLFNIAEIIEARSLDRARHAIRKLLELAPETATVQHADGSWKEIQARDLTVDMVSRVRPGERIAADGIVVQGQSTVDQSPITGESLPIEKTAGDAVYAATINGAGSFAYRVTAAAGNSTLARIIHAVEQAQSARAPTQRFCERLNGGIASGHSDQRRRVLRRRAQVTLVGAG